MNYLEYTNKYEIKESYDVIVCGGGPAGVCAAVSAGREGAKTLLIERNGELGGFWTSGLLTWIADVCDKPGLVKEIVEQMRKRADGRIEYRDREYFTADTESTKLLFEEMCAKANVDVQLYTLVTGVTTEDKRITGVLTDSKTGHEYFKAKIVIDATGDGDVGAYAKCRCEIGNQDGETQPMSMIAQLAGIKYDDLENLYKDNSDIPKNKCILKELNRAGVTPSYAHPLIAPVSKENDLFAFMANHEYNVSATSARDLTKASMHARKEIFGYIKALRSLGGIWKNIHIVSTASNIGVREGRRIMGKYYITLDKDLAQGLTHPDGICTVTYNMDIHHYNPNSEKSDFEKIHKVQTKPYEIPFRALISADVDGLMMAGRCISGDFYSYGNFRVGGNAARTGEAAGTAAGYSIKHNIPIDKLTDNIKDILKRHDI